MSWNDREQVIRRTRTLEAVGVYRNEILAGGPATPPEALYGLRVTANLFPLLGVSPMLGRNILPEDDRPGQSDRMILSYGLWVRRFNSDRSGWAAMSQSPDTTARVIGLTPPEFNVTFIVAHARSQRSQPSLTFPSPP